MPTLNINGNIRTNTAAGWAADATVYTAKTILVTTDATYGVTDQRKFKIADGTQTWSNLDYFPVSGYDDASSSIQTQLNAKLTSANITQTITNGVTDKAPSEDAVFDALALKQNTLTNPVTGTGTNNEISYFTGASTIASLTTATYPSLTELSYVKGVTSAIQTQLNSKTDQALFFSLASNTVGDLQTYYFGQMFGTLSTTTNQSGAVPIKAGTIIGAIIATFNGSTVGSNEACTLSLLHGSSFGTTSQITNALTVDANRQAVQIVTGLSITVTDCNALMKLDSPTLATNPTGWQCRIILIYQ